MGQNFGRLDVNEAPLQIKKFQLILSYMYLNLSFQLDLAWHLTFTNIDFKYPLAFLVSMYILSYLPSTNALYFSFVTSVYLLSIVNYGRLQSHYLPTVYQISFVQEPEISYK